MKYTQTLKKSQKYAGNKKTKKQYSYDFQKKLRRFALMVKNEYTKRPVKVSTQDVQVETPVHTLIKYRNNFDRCLTSFIEIEVKNVPKNFRNMPQNTWVLVSNNIYMFFGTKSCKTAFKRAIDIDL